LKSSDVSDIENPAVGVAVKLKYELFVTASAAVVVEAGGLARPCQVPVPYPSVSRVKENRALFVKSPPERPDACVDGAKSVSKL